MVALSQRTPHMKGQVADLKAKVKWNDENIGIYRNISLTQEI